MVSFDINTEAQIAATDANSDDRVLTPGDQVYIIRVVTGDVLPYSKRSPFALTIYFTRSNGVISVESVVNVGAVFFAFDGAVGVQLLAGGMKIKSDIVNGQTRILTWWSNDKNHTPAGESDILSVSGNATSVATAASDYYGNLWNVEIDQAD